MWMLWDWDAALGTVTILTLPPALVMEKSMSPVTHYTVQVHTDMQVLSLLNKLSWSTFDTQHESPYFGIKLVMLWYSFAVFTFPFASAVHGGWSTWSAWSECSSDCDTGVQTRERFCSSPPPLYGGSSCVGPQIQTRDCNSQPCTGFATHYMNI